jgi:hypothetical protein
MTGQEVSRGIDQELEQLIDPIDVAIGTRSCVAVIQPWQRARYLSLLPFHLQLRWPGRISGLSLNPRIGLIPFLETESLIADAPHYLIEQVLAIRRAARADRGRKGAHPNDFKLQDWEEKEKRLCRLESMLLPGSSYISVDQVNQNGVLVQGRRSVLGRLSARGGMRPNVLVPSRRAVSLKSANVFKELDLLIVDVQHLRARKVLSEVQDLVRYCINKVPMVIVGTSPTDLLPFRDLDEQMLLTFSGKLPTNPKTYVTLVGKDRPSAEREFEFAVEGLDERQQVVADLMHLARYSWWVLRQTIYQPNTTQALHFFTAFDRASTENPLEARMFTGAHQLLNRELNNDVLRLEREHAVINAILRTQGPEGTLVVVRNEHEARQIRAKIAKELDSPHETLEEVGVVISGRSDYWPTRSFGCAIAAGYFGPSTIDVLLASRASLVHFVSDPIEARAAWFQLQKVAELLRKAIAPQAQQTILGLAEELSPHVAAFSDTTTLSLRLSGIGNQLTERLKTRYSPSPDAAIIIFTDGSEVDVGLHARFEAMREAGKRLKSVEALELQPGDQVVVLHEDSRELFSEKLLSTLDQGILAEQTGKRATWLSIVQSVFERTRPSAQAIARYMYEKGHPVDLKTVRSWMRFNDTHQTSVPDRPARFLAFAAALGITLPDSYLLDLWNGIENRRINHRKFGRILSRAVRAAYLGNLDAVTVTKIEREWGMNARQLIEGARLAVVDEVILPKDVEYAAH